MRGSTLLVHQAYRSERQSPPGEDILGAEDVAYEAETLPLQQGRVTGAMGWPVPEHRPGDCYAWGSCEPHSSASHGHSAASVCNGAPTAVPTLVRDSAHLDICEVRCL